MKAIINGKLVTPKGILRNKVLVFNERIKEFRDNVPTNCHVIDAKGMYVTPGLIDVHVHGSCGADTMDQTVEAIKLISQGIAKNGVTSFLPTTMTMSREDIYGALDIVRECMNKTLNGAKVLGAHLEGPFINAIYKGAQPERYIIKPSYDFIKEYTDVIKLVTYAPEMDDNYSFTKEVKEKTDITLSIGHTNATYNQAKQAFACGCSHVTHLFNAMTPLNHREPGVVGAALTSDVFTELIADTIHVNQELFQFILDNKGKDKMILITDSMRAGCMKDGKYDLGGQEVIVKDGAARLSSGTLAGSVLTLNKAIYNFFQNTDATFDEVIHMGTLNPATSIGVSDFKGSLEIEKDADIAIFDEEMNCYLSIVEGREVYNKLY
ncbi:N-acetylglucosamine-6-phosphate deacetylase [Turicibacter sanguinis]|nr:N-acetylglucosamine-6-phosphate deacetylase [Turicibacter sanguinis]